MIPHPTQSLLTFQPGCVKRQIEKRQCFLAIFINSSNAKLIAMPQKMVFQCRN